MQTISRRNTARLLALAVASISAISLHAIAAAPAPLAINGYDPVAYFVAGKPMLGEPQFETEYDHRRYRFSTAANLALFKAEPAHYAPQYKGQCALDLADGKVSPIIPDAWLIRDGKLYLFGAPQGPAVFQEHYADNVAKANQNSALIPGQ